MHKKSLSSHTRRAAQGRTGAHINKTTDSDSRTRKLYLLEKEQVCGLDKEERYELDELMHD